MILFNTKKTYTYTSGQEIALSPRIRLVSMRTLLLILIFLVSACVPVIRTEYLSPSWQGTLVDIQTGAPLEGVEVSDLFTLKKVKTDHQGYFELAPKISQFSLKLPVASMARFYQIEIALPDSQLRFSGHRLATTTEPSNFDIGTFPINNSANNGTFLLENNGEKVELPAHFVEKCGAPLQDAIRLTNAARLYKKSLETKQNLGDMTITQKDIELTYYWAYKSWDSASGKCFRHDYEQSVAFKPYLKYFFQEARVFLNTDDW